MTPLNGTKTHPLSVHAIMVLRELSRGALPSNMINPGVINRLMREDLIKIVMLASPYKTHKGRLIDHAKITERGLRAMEDTNGRS